MRRKVEEVAREVKQNQHAPDPARAGMVQAREVDAFVAAMPPVRTEREVLALGLLARIDELRRRDGRDSTQADPKREE